MLIPEPCLRGVCRSPVACGSFGYCRERNWDDTGRVILPDQDTAQQWRQLAAQRKAGESSK